MVANDSMSTMDGVVRGYGCGWEGLGEIERDREGGKARGVGFSG